MQDALDLGSFNCGRVIFDVAHIDTSFHEDVSWETPTSTPRIANDPVRQFGGGVCSPAHNNYTVVDSRSSLVARSIIVYTRSK